MVLVFETLQRVNGTSKVRVPCSLDEVDSVVHYYTLAGWRLVAGYKAK